MRRQVNEYTHRQPSAPMPSQVSNVFLFVPYTLTASPPAANIFFVKPLVAAVLLYPAFGLPTSEAPLC